MQNAESNGNYTPVPTDPHSDPSADPLVVTPADPLVVTPADPPVVTPADPPVVTPADPPADPPTDPQTNPPPVTTADSTVPAVRNRVNGVLPEVSEPKPPKVRVPWDQVCQFLSSELCGSPDFRMVLRSIMGKSGYLNGDGLINEHTHNYPRDVKEVIYQVLSDWTKKSPRCTLDMVFEGLREENQNLIVSKLQEKEFLKKYSEESGESIS
ncbi:gibberellin-regulated protein 14-like isoform X2 [Pecten maximus]|uniref:gibberellin-regulated protein 14-like isoform X2 n=1 Tax=Pecten maximus TaxID=6579 RepID=UPI001457F583|nr:gibberellin-regulated protein 14-like isoform X2 [Pecten maximus]